MHPSVAQRRSASTRDAHIDFEEEFVGSRSMSPYSGSSELAGAKPEACRRRAPFNAIAAAQGPLSPSF